MITKFTKKCPECGDKIVYTNPHNPPATCYKRMCDTNYNSKKNRLVIESR